MKKVGRLFLAFILTFALAIPVSLQWSDVASAKRKDISDVKKHEENFKNNHISDSWIHKGGGKIKVKIYYDVNGVIWAPDDGEIKVILQKYDEKGKKWNKYKSNEKKIEAKGRTTEQLVTFTDDLRAGHEYRLYFKHVRIHSGPGISHRISYNVSQDSPASTNDYKLNANYIVKPGGNDDELKFTIKNKDNHEVPFEGIVTYDIKPNNSDQSADGETDKKAGGNSRTIKISKFKEEEHLPNEWKVGDSENSRKKTTINVTYIGSIDGSKKNYKITKTYNILRNNWTSELEVKSKDNNNGKLDVSAKVGRGNGERKFTFELKKEKNDTSNLDEIVQKDKDNKAQVSFARDKFNGFDKAHVKVTFTGQLNNDERVILQKATKTISVNKPKEPQNSNGGNNNGGSNNGGGNNNGGSNDGGNNNGGNNNGGNKGGKNEEKVNEDATIDIKSKILEDDKVEIKATLKKVDDPKGTWKLKFNDGETKTYEEEKGSITKTFSTKNIEKDKVKFTAKFTGKDSKGKINVTKTEEIKVKEEKDDDQGDASGNNQDDDQGDASGNNKDDNQGDASGNNQDDDQGDASGNNKQDPPAKENKDAKITLTPTILENDQVEIKASLENAEEPNGTWTLTFNEGDPKTFENQGASITETYSTKDIKETKVPVTAKFVGKDKENKTIEQEITEQVTVKKEITPPPVVDATGDDGGTTTDNDDEVVGQVVTPPNSPSGQIGGQLPKTATHYSTGLIAGILFFISGAFVLLWRRRTT